MKHFKIVNFEKKTVYEFDIKDNEMLVWDIVDSTPTKEYYRVTDEAMEKTTSNYDRYHARKSDLK